MGRVRHIACIAASVVVSSCVLLLSAPASAQDAGPPFTDWNPQQPGYPSNAPVNSRATCDSGSRACIDRTVAEMIRRFNTVVPSCDDNNVFSITYLRVTEDIRNGLDDGYYADPGWLNRLDALFARPYFLSYDNYMAGRIALVPPAWRIAYDAGRDGTVKGIGNLLLSMNAHVNRDFPFVLYQAGLVDAGGNSRKQEHDNGNARLRALYRPMIDELTARFDPSIDDYDVPGTTVDDEALFSVLVGWRETAWQNAVRLAEAKNDAERRQVAASIEQYALAQAYAIYAGSAYAPGETTAAREAQCAANGGQDPEYDRGSDVARFRGKKAKVTLAELRVPISCPDGPGPCMGDASWHGVGTRFELDPGERTTVGIPIPADIGIPARVRVRLKSLLEPGNSVLKRRKLRTR